MAKDLLPPCSYRFYGDQKAWLQRKAKEEGHLSEVAILRRLVEQAMKSDGKRLKRAS